MSRVSLRRVTADNMWDICNLTVSHEQQNFVAPNSVSLAQAGFNSYAWYRAIYAGESIVGFVMLYDNPFTHDYYLWRLMIDLRFQGKGYGRKAMLLLIEHVKTRPGAAGLGTSCVPGPASPEPFYRALGFEATGEMEDDEKVLRLAWAEPRPAPSPRVCLKPVSPDNIRDICRLRTTKEQEKEVIDPARSLAESLFYSHLRTWGIYKDDAAVGFLMWEDNPEKTSYSLWRLVIDHRHQGKGYGRDAMEQLIEIVGRRPDARELKTSFVPGPGGPERFYLNLGFLPTGQWLDGEQVYTVPTGDSAKRSREGN